MDSEDAIKYEYKNEGLEYIDAIQRLETLGYSSKDAEILIEEWDL